MSVSEPQARLAVRNVEELVGLVPFLIGFHPAESLVVMMIEDQKVAVTARIDLAAVTDAEELAGLVTRLFDRFPRAEAWFVAYTADLERAWVVLADCVGLTGAARLGRVLQVGDGRWRADHPDGPGGSMTGAVTAAAAHAALLGLPARASRQELADSITGPPDAEIGELVRIFDEQSEALGALSAAGRRRVLQRLLRDPAPSTVSSVRLAILAAAAEGQLLALRQLNRDTAEEQLAAWSSVVRHSLLAYQAVPLGLLGMAAWQAGDGALQMICLERLDRIDPGAPLARVIALLNREVVPPGAWDEVRRPLLAALAPALRAASAPWTAAGG